MAKNGRGRGSGRSRTVRMIAAAATYAETAEWAVRRYGTMGAASEVRRIDPKTGEVMVGRREIK